MAAHQGFVRYPHQIEVPGNALWIIVLLAIAASRPPGAASSGPPLACHWTSAHTHRRVGPPASPPPSAPPSPMPLPPPPPAHLAAPPSPGAMRRASTRAPS